MIKNVCCTSAAQAENKGTLYDGGCDRVLTDTLSEDRQILDIARRLLHPDDTPVVRVPLQTADDFLIDAAFPELVTEAPMAIENAKAAERTALEEPNDALPPKRRRRRPAPVADIENLRREGKSGGAVTKLLMSPSAAHDPGGRA